MSALPTQPVSAVPARSQDSGSFQVVHVTTERGWGGGERQLLLLMRELRKHGIQQKLAAPAGSPVFTRGAEAGYQVVALHKKAPMHPANVARLMRMRAYHVASVVVLSLAMAISPPAVAASSGAKAVSEHRALTAEGRTPAHNSFTSRLRSDLADLLRRPTHMSSRDWEHLGLGLAAVGAAASLDTEIRTRVQRHRTSRSENFANDIRPAGEWGALAALGVTWIVGRAGNHPNLQATAEDGFEASIIAAGLITPALKVAVGRSRPVEGLGAGHFSPVSGHHSFPSGEATEAFAVASVVAAHTDSRWLQGGVWGLAGLVGWERIELDHHWTSDVVAGALIGAEVGRWVVARHRSMPSQQASIVVLPVVAPGTLAVSGAVIW